MITKAKVDRIVAELREMAAKHGKKSDVAISRTMAGYHKGKQDAYEIAVAILEGLSAGGDGAVWQVDTLIDKSIKQIGKVSGSENAATSYFFGHCEGREDGSRAVEGMIRAADEVDE